VGRTELLTKITDKQELVIVRKRDVRRRVESKTTRGIKKFLSMPLDANAVL